MKKLNLLVLLISLLVVFDTAAQKKSLTHDDIESWMRITEKVISPDGELIAYKTAPWKGDTEVFLYTKKGDKLYSVPCGTGLKFTDDSKYLVFTLKPAADLVRELKLNKTKKDDMPGDKLLIYDVDESKPSEISNLYSYKMPDEWSGFIAYQVKNSADKEDDDDNEDKQESDKNGYTLHLKSLVSGAESTWPFVKQYFFAEEGRKLVFVSGGNDEFDAGLYEYDCESASVAGLHAGEGEYKQTRLSKNGSLVAFLYAEKDKKEYAVYLSENGNKASELLNSDSSFLKEGWQISEHGSLRFSDNNKRLFFGTSEIRPERDSTILDEDYPEVDIWHGSEGILHTVQVINRERDLKKNYLAMYGLEDAKTIQIETPDIDEAELICKGNSDKVLLLSNKPYELQSMWEGSPEHYDVYLLDLVKGEKKQIKKDIRANIKASSGGKYLVWYNYPDYSYYSYNISTGKEYKLTDQNVITTQNELNDSPNYASPYGPAGWLENDEALLIYDRYDIWKLDPENAHAPVNMTVNGRETRTDYNLILKDWDKDFIDKDASLYLKGVNDNSRASAYYSWSAKKAQQPEKIIGGEYNLSNPIKADDSNTVIYTSETFNDYPEIQVSDLKFSKPVCISNANPQQKDFLWGSAELYSWTSLDGRKLEGLLYKPENFDPSKKYPMIVNFYEKSSSGLFSYRMPELHRSTIDYHYYTSNGYIIFNPDVYYREGYPGESAYNCVIPGVTALIGEGFIDEDRIGAQGHSWGGYQVAYLATRTDIFAAIESGAPVVNMFSAYGGIRWGTGLNRSFQYEHTQSRIGKTIWESPLRYIENSPLFTMDKVNTPILIMHNDSDGHVPWYQGIEYFIALRRLQKPVWMLNYSGEPHWPTKLKNKKDFQIRLSQFFAHYLKGEPMPVWMKDGIPATERDYNLGY